MLFFEEAESIQAATVILTGVTDNLGNQGLGHRNMTSKFPLYFVLLEVEDQLLCRNIGLNLVWLNRSLNHAADSFTFSNVSDFSLGLRIETPLDQLLWKDMPALMKQTLELEFVYEKRKL